MDQQHRSGKYQTEKYQENIKQGTEKYFKHRKKERYGFQKYQTDDRDQKNTLNKERGNSFEKKYLV